MFRNCMLLALLLGATLIGGAAVPGGDGKGDRKEAANLELELPEGVLEGLGGEYASKLLIDGKDFTGVGKRGDAAGGSAMTRRLKVTPAKGKDSVTVVYTYWPYAYSRTTRTKVVKLVEGKVVKASLMKADKAHPDKIYAIYVPTPQSLIEEACKLAKVKAGDVVVDIGCGDGRFCITAVKQFKAKKAIGWDIDPERIKEARDLAKQEKVDDRVTFEKKDALTIKDFSQASVVFVYLGEDLGAAVGPVLRKTLKPGARVVSHRFPLGDWKPDLTKEVKAKGPLEFEASYTLHLWTIKTPPGKGRK